MTTSLPGHIRIPNVLALILAIGLFCTLQTHAFGSEATEHEQIDYLLDVIGSSDLVFIRNGSVFSGLEAKAHLQRKMYFSSDSIQTTDDFINYIASESSTTGIIYYIRFPDGTQIEAGSWLRNKLAEKK